MSSLEDGREFRFQTVNGGSWNPNKIMKKEKRKTFLPRLVREKQMEEMEEEMKIQGLEEEEKRIKRKEMSKRLRGMVEVEVFVEEKDDNVDDDGMSYSYSPDEVVIRELKICSILI
ncbi:hypothetical protein OROGR_004423 [Orobanche gracilis]